MAPVDGENLKVLPQFGFSAELSEKPNCIGMKPTVLAERKLRLKNFWTEIMEKRNDNPRYALCLENKDCEDLEKRKIYQVLPDDDAKQEGYLRVIDESGEDYLYPESYFILIQLPHEAQEALRITA